LLEGDDEDVYEDAPTSRPAGRGKLKSPLLAGDDDDYPQPQRQSGSGGLRSPLLGGGDTDNEQHSGRSASGKHHLRSPLLGGQDDDFEEPPRPVGRSAGLRSPILGSAETVPMGRGSAFVEIDDEEEGGDHHLRSPLLASKVPMHDKPAAPKSPKSEALPARSSPVEPFAGAELLSGNQAGSEQSWGGQAAPAMPSFGGPSPAAPPPFPQSTATDLGSPSQRPLAVPPQAVNPAENALRSTHSPNAPSSQVEGPAARHFGSEPPGPGPARPESSASSGLAGGLAGSSITASVPAQNKPMAGPGALLGPAMAPNFDEPIGSNADSTTAYSGLSGLGQPAPSAPSQTPVNLSGLRGMGTNTAHDEADAGSKKRRFKGLEETEPVVQETHERHTPGGPNRFGGQSHAPAPPAAALPGFVKILALPLLFAAIMKALVLMDWLKTPQTPFTVIGDQIGQLLVCISLIIICVSAGNSRS
jgi:hypothetical protein